MGPAVLRRGELRESSDVPCSDAFKHPSLENGEGEEHIPAEGTGGSVGVHVREEEGLSC